GRDQTWSQKRSAEAIILQRIEQCPVPNQKGRKILFRATIVIAHAIFIGHFQEHYGRAANSVQSKTLTFWIWRDLPPNHLCFGRYSGRISFSRSAMTPAQPCDTFSSASTFTPSSSGGLADSGVSCSSSQKNP